MSALRRVSLAVVSMFVAAGLQVGTATVASAESAPTPDVLETFERPDVQSAQMLARTSGHEVEVTDMRSRTSTFWVSADGSLRQEVSLKPVRFLDAAGDWQSYDLTLRAQADGSYAPVAHDNVVKLPAAASGALRLPTWAGQITMTHPGAAVVAPEVADTVATYPDALSGRDLRVQATLSGFEESVIVPTAGLAGSYSTRFTLPSGVSARQVGNYVEFIEAGGRVVASYGGGRAFDSATPLRSETAVAVTLIAQAARTATVAVAVPPAWLADPERVFPATIDPDYSLHSDPSTATPPNRDTYVDKTVNAGYPSGKELYMGSVQATTYRSLLWFDMSAVTDASTVVSSATLRLYNTFSVSCTPTPVQVYGLGGPFSNATVWTNQPGMDGHGQVTQSSYAHGAAPALCKPDWAVHDVTTLVQRWASGTEANNGLVVQNDTAPTGHKRFASGEAGAAQAPVLNITYNHRPNVPWNRNTTPAGQCKTGASRPSFATLTPTLSAGTPDRDRGTTRTGFLISPVGNPSVVNALGYGDFMPAGTQSSWTVPVGALVNGSSYMWKAKGWDHLDSSSTWTDWCEFTVDTVAPSAPTVSSTAYPAGTWAGAHNQTASFTYAANGSADTAGYQASIDAPNHWVYKDLNTLGASFTPSLTLAEGPHALYVRAYDRAGNRSPVTTYSFNVGQGGIVDPAVGSRSTGSVTLTAAARPTYTSLTWQWRRGSADAWTTATGLTTTTGAPLTQPLTLTGGLPPAAIWTPSALVDGPVEIRATFTGPGGSADSQVRSITLDRSDFSSATEQAGPGRFALRSGNFQLSSTDVSVDAYGSDLTLMRTFNSRAAAAGANGPFGPGWVSSVPVETAGSSYRSLAVTGSVAALTLAGDETLTFAAQSDGSWAPEMGAEDLKLTYAAAEDRYDLTDLDGNVTGFTKPSGSASYVPTSVTQTGDSSATKYAYEVVTVGGESVTRPTTMLAPVPVGVSCSLANTAVRGCRSLTFDYAAANTSPPAAGATGDFPARLRQVSLTAWNPDSGAMSTIPLAAYDYYPDGRLARGWDPRTSALKTTYTYGAGGQVATLTPPGEEPWSISYASVTGDATTGRLRAVSRASLDPTHPTAVTTAVYNVPLSGAAAPYDMSSTQLDRTGQWDRPVTATAVFPPTQEPTGDANTLPSSYERAAVHYLDANGREVNLAVPGGGISSVEYDQWGNVNRTLTAANRQRALDQAASVGDEAVLADTLSTNMYYLDNGIDMWATTGPEHTALLTLSSGSPARQRQLTFNTFNEGAPAGGPYHLVTTSLTKGWTLGDPADYDVRTTKSQYGTTAESWTLGLPTAVTTDPTGLALTRRHTYTSDGRVVTETLPSGGTSTSTAATRKTVYYTVGANGDDPLCGNRPEWVNLACATRPGGQPTGTPLPTRYTSYDVYNHPTVSTEITPGGATLRVTTVQYDSAGRAWKTTIDTPGVAGDAALPTTEVIYDPTTGRATRTNSLDSSGAVTASIIRGYDALGRLTSYTDADGQVSTTTYDFMSRPVTTDDGKGTQTRYYDEGTERRGLLTRLVDSHAGTWTATYDLAGTPTVDWPNGLRQTTTVSETGEPIKIAYVKTGCTGDDCIWLSNEVRDSAHGQVNLADGLSEQAFGYDKAGRLVTAFDQQSPVCLTRSYTYDVDSNRTAEAAYGPAADGACQTTSVASSETHNYDQADRITDAGYAYDALGRTVVVPDGDTLDLGGASGAATVSYHANDLVRSVVQGAGAMTTYNLDIDGQRIRSKVTGATTVLNHYDYDGDNPSWWTSGPSAWTRAIGGVGGGLAALYDTATGQATLQLSNLHGDIVATASTSPSATALTATFESTEFGIPRSTVAAAPRYSWLGKAERASDNPAGLTLMGVRLYNPASGRFLQTDPIVGGNANAYDYCTGDPINCFDLDGRWGWKKWAKRALKVAEVGALVGCAVCAGVVAAYSAYQAYSAFRSGSYGGAAWAIAGAIPGGRGLRGATEAGMRGARYSGKIFKSEQGARAAAHRYANKHPHSCAFRDVCSAGNHVHVDRSFAGRIVHTRHYYWD